MLFSKCTALSARDFSHVIHSPAIPLLLSVLPRAWGGPTLQCLGWVEGQSTPNIVDVKLMAQRFARLAFSQQDLGELVAAGQGALHRFAVTNVILAICPANHTTKFS